MGKGKKSEAQKISLENFQEEIRKRAEEIYKERISKNKPGDALSDWLQAEKEIKRKYGI
jgi:predicted HTH domain antitoxin